MVILIIIQYYIVQYTLPVLLKIISKKIGLTTISTIETISTIKIKRMLTPL